MDYTAGLPYSSRSRDYHKAGDICGYLSLAHYRGQKLKKQVAELTKVVPETPTTEPFRLKLHLNGRDYTGNKFPTGKQIVRGPEYHYAIPLCNVQCSVRVEAGGHDSQPFTEVGPEIERAVQDLRKEPLGLSLIHI